MVSKKNIETKEGKENIDLNKHNNECNLSDFSNVIDLFKILENWQWDLLVKSKEMFSERR